jgi:hypothetical protein
MNIVHLNPPSRTLVSCRDWRAERGAALMLALMTMLFLMAAGTALILTTTAESTIARNFRLGSEAFYAADAVLEHAVDDLRMIPDWNAILSGAVHSTFVDGPPSGARPLADGQAIDPGDVVNLANCHKVAACSDSEMDDINAERPWGVNNPRWQAFAWGYLDDIAPPGTVSSPFFVMVLAADDPAENDGNPLRDGMAPCAQGQVSECNPGTGVLSLRAEAFGPFGAHKILELTISRPVAGSEPDDRVSSDEAGARILSWREVR